MNFNTTGKENRASLTVLNDVSSDIAFVRLDCGIYSDGNSCDFSISSQTLPPCGFLLELKGRDMHHAIEQLACTLNRLKKNDITVIYKEASVVSSGAQKIPSGKWQKCQKQFFTVNRIRLSHYPNNAKILFSKTIV